ALLRPGDESRAAAVPAGDTRLPGGAPGAALRRRVLLHGALLPDALAARLFGGGHAVLSARERNSGHHLPDVHGHALSGQAASCSFLARLYRLPWLLGYSVMRTLSFPLESEIAGIIYRMFTRTP